ncbi:uncharacterized protein LOC141587495 [Silene latifolia]|uniref:uncharacterized protein LOC141587495 n=1 Tax=Silene latifolia TaxID=37657 RepID=UPI003D770E82
MKIDLKKAYDSIEWKFIEQMLIALRFPPQMVTWIMGKRGIRQGDPMSPLIFTICMEYLSRILDVVTDKGDRGSIKVLLKAFVTFSSVSGLEMNCDKSNIYFNGVSQAEIDYVLRISGFKAGQFPFRYRDSISYKCMAIGDCTRLVEKSVLSQLHVYWSRIFVIPATVIDRITTICRNFLWSASDKYGRTPAVSWESVCTAKKHGGLGVVNSRKWNLAMIGKYTWWLACKSDHLWIRWVNHIYMKGEDWKHYEPSQNTSWTWRMICKVKNILKAGYVHNNWALCSVFYTINALVIGGFKDQWLRLNGYHSLVYSVEWLLFSTLYGSAGTYVVLSIG